MTTPARHSERCRDCKVRVRQLLEAIYGQCIPNHRFIWPTRLSSYVGTPVHDQLERVVAAIEAHRGYRIAEFVRSQRLAPCDYWVPDPGFVLEFDESQHFTALRSTALGAYADDLPLGFSSTRWMELCQRHSSSDNDPPYRDEQRAWYDTLRDLVPIIHGHLPTVRVYARDLAWCVLNPAHASDREKFAAIAFRHVRPQHPCSAFTHPASQNRGRHTEP